MRRQIDEEFGRRVREVLAQHGGASGPMSLRAADDRTEVNHVTLGEMASGRIPSMESVVKFALGFGLPVGEWLKLAGFPALPESNADRYVAGLAALGEKHGVEEVKIRLQAGFANMSDLTPEGVDALLADLDTQLTEKARLKTKR